MVQMFVKLFAPKRVYFQLLYEIHNVLLDLSFVKEKINTYCFEA